VASSKERERQLARERYERQLRRREQQRRRTRQTGIVVATVVAVAGVVAAVAVLAIGSSGGSTKPSLAASPGTSASTGASASASSSASSTASPSSSASGSPAGNGFCKPAPPKPAHPQRFASEPPLTIDPKATYHATLATNCGTIEADLFAGKAPHTVNSFAFLAGKGYFTDVPCHRVTSAGIFVLQCGDPTGSGSGGPGYQFRDENLDAFGPAGAGGTVTYPAGTLAMANAGPGTNGSQFFIVYKDSPLAPSYTPFGTVTKGLAIVSRVAAAGSSPAGDGAPTIHVSLTKVTVAKR
jgi:peptidyl-prolyl cis-trans isomerase B (cyclophilin B)